MDRKLELISQVPLFARCSKHELEEIAKAADEIDLPEGKELTREGDRGREFFVLIEGAADVTKDGQVIRRLGAGDFLGEIALISREPRTATVTTTAPTEALVITDQAFAALMAHMPEVQQKVLETLADRLAPGSI